MGLFDFFGALTGFKSIAITAAVSLALGAGIGGTAAYKYRDARCIATIDTAALNTANETISRLEENIRLNDAALAADAIKAAADQVEIDRMKGTVNDLLSKISGGVCLSADDVDRLRQWWGSAARPAVSTPRRSPRRHTPVLPKPNRLPNAGANPAK